MANPEVVKFDAERLQYWKSVGAKLSERVERITKQSQKWLKNLSDNMLYLYEKVKIDDNFYEIIIYADKTDTGKLIGKNGQMINAIRTVVLGYKAKDAASYKFSVKALEEQFYERASYSRQNW